MRTFYSEFNVIVVHILVIGLTVLTFVIAINTDVIVSRDIHGFSELPYYFDRQLQLNEISKTKDRGNWNSFPSNKITFYPKTDTCAYFFLLVFDKTSSVDDDHLYLRPDIKELIRSINSILKLKKQLKQEIDRENAAYKRILEINNQHFPFDSILTRLDLQSIIAIYYTITLNLGKWDNHSMNFLSIANYYGLGKLQTPLTSQDPSTLIKYIIKNYMSYKNALQIKKKNNTPIYQRTDFAEMTRSLNNKYTNFLNQNPYFKIFKNKKVIITLFSDFLHEEDSSWTKVSKNNQKIFIKTSPFARVEKELQGLSNNKIFYQFNLVKMPIDSTRIPKQLRGSFESIIDKTMDLFKKYFINTFFYVYDIFRMSDDNFTDYIRFMCSPVVEYENTNNKIVFYYPFEKFKSLNTSLTKINTGYYRKFFAQLETNSSDKDFDLTFHYSNSNKPNIQDSRCFNVKQGSQTLIKCNKTMIGYLYNSQTMNTSPDLFLVLKNPYRDLLYRYAIKFERRISKVNISLFRIACYLTFLPFLYLFLYYFLFIPLYVYKLQRNDELCAPKFFIVVKKILFLLTIPITILTMFCIYKILNLLFKNPNFGCYFIWYLGFAIVIILAIGSHYNNQFKPQNETK